MKAYEFITEYQRDKTAAALGDNLLKTFARLNAFFAIRDFGVYDEHTIAHMSMYPEYYPDRNIRITAMNKPVYVSPGPRAQEVLEQIKPYILSKILEAIENKDPTQNKEYTQWLARMWASGKVEFEDLNRNDLLSVHAVGKKRKMIPAAMADINRFKTYSQFEDAMSSVDADKILGSTATVDRGQFKQLYDSPEVRVIQPLDKNASCYYGRGTRWCTATTRGNNYFDYYSSNGPLYILIPKVARYIGEKYQIHFSSNQVMNHNDEPVDLHWLLTDRFPELFEFFDKSDNISSSIIFQDPEIISKVWNKFTDLIVNEKDRLYRDLDDDESVNIAEVIIDELNKTSYSQMILTMKESESGYLTKINQMGVIAATRIDEIVSRADTWGATRHHVLAHQRSYVIREIAKELENWIIDHIVTTTDKKMIERLAYTEMVDDIAIGYKY